VCVCVCVLGGVTEKAETRFRGPRARESVSTRAEKKIARTCGIERDLDFNAILPLTRLASRYKAGLISPAYFSEY